MIVTTNTSTSPSPCPSTMESSLQSKIQQSPHIKRVLKSYQLSAGNTMSGPTSLSLGSNNSSGGSGNSTLAGALSNIYKKRNLELPPLLETSSYNNIIGGKNKELIFNKSQGTTITPIIQLNQQQQQQRKSPPKLLIKKELSDLTTNTETTVILQSKKSPTPSFPILTVPESFRSKAGEKTETCLEGEGIACFIVGGEPRLCFPQILTSVLRGFSLHQINQVCDELQIFCSRCSSEQLEVLKLSAIIPKSAPSCGLITKTDAERLVTSLLHRNPPKAAVSVLSAVNRPQDPNQPNSISHFRIYHECFGKGRGVLLPHLYEKPDSLCIECIDCHGLFSPPRFVSHSHQPQENRTCHWGFDPAKWRNYIMVAKDQENRDKLGKTLQDFKNRFELKRKEFGSSLSLDEGNVVIKRIRYSSEPVVSLHPVNQMNHSSLFNLPSKKRLPFLNNTYSTNAESTAPDVQYQGSSYDEMNSVKNLLLAEMSTSGAELVINLLDKMNKRIVGLEQEILKNQPYQQPKQISGGFSPGSNSNERSPSASNSPKIQQHPSLELQSKVNSLETELHSLKKQLLRRHELK